jgi:hypothetical protein
VALLRDEQAAAGKKSIAGGQKCLDEFKEETGRTISLKRVKRALETGDEGQSPKKMGRQMVVPPCLYDLAAACIQICQVEGMEFDSDELTQLFQGSIDGTPYEKTSSGSQRDIRKLLAQLKETQAELLQPSLEAQVEVRRWLWAIRELYAEWFTAWENFLISIQFAFREEETGQVVLFQNMEHNILNGDETKLAVDGKERQPKNPKNNLTLTDASLPRSGKPESKVSTTQYVM